LSAEVGRHGSTKNVEEVRKKVKFLVMARWTPEAVAKSRDQFMKMKPPTLEGKFLFPQHTIVGSNSAFCIVESNSIEDVVRLTYPLTPMMTFETHPIMDSSEMMKFAQSANL
jgi:hypothetical protein